MEQLKYLDGLVAVGKFAADDIINIKNIVPILL